jgi:excisionase family DNA binding protein
MDRLAYGLSEACQLLGLGRTTLYAAIKSGELKARKVRRRTLILHDDLIAFLKALPASATGNE